MNPSGILALGLLFGSAAAFFICGLMVGTRVRQTAHNEILLMETVARAIDPLGWSWYDRAEDDHPAKPIFKARALEQAATAIAVVLRTPQ